MKLSVLAFRNIRRRRRRSLLSGGAIALVGMVMVFAFSFLAGMKADLYGNVFKYDTGHLRIRHAEYDANEDLNPLHLGVEHAGGLLPRLDEAEGVAAAVPRIRFFTGIYRNDQTYNGAGLGVDFAREEPVTGLGESLTSGRLPEMGAREILLSAGLAEELDLKAGDKITLFTKNMYMGLSGMTFTVTGTTMLPVAHYNSSFFWLPLDTAQSFLKMGDRITEIAVLLDSSKELDGGAARLTALMADRPELDVKPWTQISVWYPWLSMAGRIYNVIALVFFVLATTVIINTTMMVIFERMREIGTVAAMGMTPQQIVHLFFLEAFFIGLMASLAGVALGCGLTLVFTRTGIDLSRALQSMEYAISPVLYPILSVRSVGLVFVYSIAVASLASFIPSRRAARITPVEALRAL
jgi:putative ABC transport system permease protein